MALFGLIKDKRPSGTQVSAVIEGEYTELPLDYTVTVEDNPQAQQQQSGQQTGQQQQQQASDQVQKQKKSFWGDRQSREEVGAAKRLAEHEKRKRDIARRSEEIYEAQQQKELERFGGTKWQKFEKGAKRAEQIGKGTSKVAGALYKIGTLGGPVKMSKERRDLYVGQGKDTKRLYGSEAMRPLTEPSYEAIKDVTRLGSASNTMLGGALRQGTPSGSMLVEAQRRGTPGLTRVVGSQLRLGSGQSSQDGVLERLRSAGGQGVGRLGRLGGSKGLSPIEQLAVTSISQNRAIDTRTEAVQELINMGIPEQDAIKVIDTLIRKGVLQKGQTGLEVQQ